MTTPRGTLSLLTLSALVIAGCSSERLPTYATSGKVLFEDGRPVRFGSIEFYNREHDVIARGTIDENGEYEVGTFHTRDGAVAGEHQVIVIQMLMPTPAVPQDGSRANNVHGHERHVDEKYASYTTSSLRCTVEAGANELDFTVSESRN